MAPTISENSLEIPLSLPQNLKEEQALETFREILMPECEKFNDAFLLKWLRAKSLHISKAKKMLERYLAWRQANATIFEKMHSYTIPPAILKGCPFKLTGIDQSGRPVYFVLLGRWETRSLVENGYRNEIFPFLYKTFEEISRRIEKCRLANPDVTKCIAVLDMEQITWWKIGSVEIVNMVLKFFQEFEAYYPEFCHSVFIINSHWVFEHMFKVVKPILSSRTLSKVSIYSKDDVVWKRILQQNISLEALPIEYGGKAEPFFG